MNSGEATARLIIALGLGLVLIGLIVYVASKLGISLFHLPGDIVIKKKNVTFYFPWVSCLVLSVILSLIFYWFGRK